MTRIGYFSLTLDGYFNPTLIRSEIDIEEIRKRICYILLAVLLIKKVFPHPFAMVCLSVVLAGAVGNLIDRALQGYVVDMFALDLFQFPVFNVADIFVVCGGIAFCIAFLLPNKSEARHDR